MPDTREIDPDAEATKAATRAQWNDAAEGWDAHGHAVRRWLLEATRAMIEMAGVAPGQRVLDIAAGAGDQTLDLARRVGPRGAVVATDIAPEILARAAASARAAGHANVEILVADAERLDGISGPFDAAVCRLGLMFLPDPAAGLAAIADRLAPGARFAAMVFSEPAANPTLGIVMRTALRHAGLMPRDPFAPGSLLSLGRPGHLQSLFEAAGFAGVHALRVDAPFRMPTTRDYLDFLRASAGPILQILGRLSEPERDAAWRDIEAGLAEFQGPDGWAGPNELLLVAGRRP